MRKRGRKVNVGVETQVQAEIVRQRLGKDRRRVGGRGRKRKGRK